MEATAAQKRADGPGPVGPGEEFPTLGGDRPKEEAVRAAAGAKRPERELTAEQQDNATAWFLEEDPEEVPTRSFQLNVGVENERWVTWTVRAIDRDELRVLRRQSRRGRQGTEDDLSLNLRIAAAGTVNPPISEARVRGEFADPAEALNYRLRHKQGLIDQIAGEVLTASGYDDNDVREVTAAKNS